MIRNITVIHRTPNSVHQRPVSPVPDKASDTYLTYKTILQIKVADISRISLYSILLKTSSYLPDIDIF